MNKKNKSIGLEQNDYQTLLEVHSQRKQDIRRWQKELMAECARLEELQKVARKYCNSLYQHAQALSQIENSIVAECLNTIEYQPVDDRALYGHSTNGHDEENGILNQQSYDHSWIRDYHKSVIAQMRAGEVFDAVPMR